MSVVERLAERWDRDASRFAASRHVNYEEAQRARARWWLNTIADELLTNLDTPYAASVADVADWLRTQAKP